MEKIYRHYSILSCLLLSILFVYAQPKLVGTLSYSGEKDGGAIFRSNLPGTAPGVIHSFDHLTPYRPGGSVCAGDGDWLYGITFSGGVNKRGAFYRIRRNGTDFTKLYDVTSFILGQHTPYYHSDGNIYFIEDNVVRIYDPVTSSITGINLPGFTYTRELFIDTDDWIYLMIGSFSPQIIKIKNDGTSWTELHAFDDATEGFIGIEGVTVFPCDTFFWVLS